MPDGQDPYLRENFQRNSIIRGLSQSNENDLILIETIIITGCLQQLKST
mgnify:CR=1 FL=1